MTIVYKPAITPNVPGTDIEEYDWNPTQAGLMDFRFIRVVCHVADSDVDTKLRELYNSLDKKRFTSQLVGGV
jgi:hypothetical protein